MRNGGLLHDLLKLKYLLPEASHQEIMLALVPRLVCITHIQYIPQILRLLDLFNFRASAFLDETLTFILESISKMSWHNWNHHYYNVYKIVEHWYPSASEPVKIKVLESCTSWFKNQSGWFIQDVIQKIPAVLHDLLQNNHLSLLQFIEKYFRAEDRKDPASLAISLKLNKASLSNNYSTLVENFISEDFGSGYELLENIKEIPASDRQEFCVAMLKKLQDLEYIRVIVESGVWEK